MKKKKKRKGNRVLSFGNPFTSSLKNSPNKQSFDEMKLELNTIKEKIKEIDTGFKQPKITKETATKDELVLISKRLDFLEKEIYPLNGGKVNEVNEKKNDFLELFQQQRISSRKSSSSCSFSRNKSINFQNNRKILDEISRKGKFNFESPYLFLTDRGGKENNNYFTEVNKNFRSKIYHQFVKEINHKISEIEIQIDNLKKSNEVFKMSQLDFGKEVSSILNDMKEKLKKNYLKCSLKNGKLKEEIDVLNQKITSKVSVLEVQDALTELQIKLREFVQIETEKIKENEINNKLEIIQENQKFYSERVQYKKLLEEEKGEIIGNQEGGLVKKFNFLEEKIKSLVSRESK